jgi:SAM-dependent methyltransferase
MFDLKRLKLNKLKTSGTIESSKFHSFITQDIIDRLEPVDKSWHNILIINNNFELLPSRLQEEFRSASIVCRQYPDEFETIEQAFDLIIFPWGMHWVTDVQQLLAGAKKLLEPNGILMCNFPGGGSLRKLRHLLVQLEINHGHGHSPHLSPLIQFEHVTPLLQQAGFIENIIDMESFELEYKSPLELMRAVKNTGESNVLSNRGGYSISKAMYNSLTSMPDGKFIDHLNLITFLASPSKKSVKLKAEYFNPAPRT